MVFRDEMGILARTTKLCALKTKALRGASAGQPGDTGVLDHESSVRAQTQPNEAMELSSDLCP